MKVSGNIKITAGHKYFFSLLFFFLVSIGCQRPSPEFHIKDLAKTDIDKVSQIHMDQVKTILEELTVKLYRKNPAELQKIRGATIQSRIEEIFSCPPGEARELDSKEGTDAILLGFDPKFEGDRVFAVMFGLYSMLHRSYNGKCELFMLDYLDAQSLYNSARNIEIFVWRLKTREKKDGSLYILTNDCSSEVQNLSYERIFGKLISLQDTMAKIISQRSGRIITQVVQAAGMAFLPVNL